MLNVIAMPVDTKWFGSEYTRKLLGSHQEVLLCDADIDAIVTLKGGESMKKIKKNVAASWCCEASTVVDVKKLVKKSAKQDKQQTYFFEGFRMALKTNGGKMAT